MSQRRFKTFRSLEHFSDISWSFVFRLLCYQW